MRTKVLEPVLNISNEIIGRNEKWLTCIVRNSTDLGSFPTTRRL
ncbi:MAG: hypothetical protein R2728_16350 [Chitinophagales bacterium]